jgi:hypothetical protein
MEMSDHHIDTFRYDTERIDGTKMVAGGEVAKLQLPSQPCLALLLSMDL